MKKTRSNRVSTILDFLIPAWNSSHSAILHGEWEVRSSTFFLYLSRHLFLFFPSPALLLWASTSRNDHLPPGDQFASLFHNFDKQIPFISSFSLNKQFCYNEHWLFSLEFFNSSRNPKKLNCWLFNILQNILLSPLLHLQHYQPTMSYGKYS